MSDAGDRRPPARLTPRTKLPGVGICGHAGAHEYVSFSPRANATEQRDQIATMPVWRAAAVSELYTSSAGGWAWTVCVERGRRADRAGSDTPERLAEN